MVLFSFFAEGALRVTIDPGHGGNEDTGAVYNQIKEADLALKISQKLYQKLQQDPDFKVQILRQTDKELSLESRVEKTQAFQSQLYLSIHLNAHPDPRAKGTEFYIQNQLPPDKDTLFLAHNEELLGQSDSIQPLGDVESILFDLKKNEKILRSYQFSTYLRKNWSPIKSKMIRQGPFFVLSQNQIPAVLIEVGYLSHPEERKKLNRQQAQDEWAEKIYLALKDYTKNMDKLPSGILKPEHAQTR